MAFSTRTAGAAPISARTLRLRRVAVLGTTALLLLALIYFSVGATVVLLASRPVRHPFAHTPRQYGLTYLDVSFPSRVDDVPLQGWLLAAAAGRPPRRPVVIVDGLAQDRESEAYGRVLEVAAALTHQGHAVLTYDGRAEGRSGGAHVTLGALEVRDVAGAIDLLAERGMARDGVDLLGYSMGAAAALREAATDPRVRAVAADSSYVALATELAAQLPKQTGLPGFFVPGVVLLAQPLLGVDVAAVRPIYSVRTLAAHHVPLLIIEGEADDIVPPATARRLAAAYGPGVATEFVPGAPHSGSYKTDPAGYLARLNAFFDQNDEVR